MTSNVLIVEDNLDYATSLKKILEAETTTKYSAEIATTLGAAIERLRKGGVDIVTLDLTLPDADGIWVIGEIIAADPDIRVLVLTNRSDGRTEEAAKAAGADDYILKTDDIREIKTKLNSIIIHRRAAKDRHEIEEVMAKQGRIVARWNELVEEKIEKMREKL